MTEVLLGHTQHQVPTTQQHVILLRSCWISSCLGGMPIIHTIERLGGAADSSPLPVLPRLGPCTLPTRRAQLTPYFAHKKGTACHVLS